MGKGIAAVMLCIGMHTYGQYTMAFGLRAGETSGITGKGFIGDDLALEGMLGLWHRGLSGTFLVEKYAPAFHAPGLNWFYGGGAHLAVITGEYDWYRYGQRRYYYANGGTGLGIDGIIGLEYKIPAAPVAISIDLKPFVEFNTAGGGWVALDPGAGIKITL